MPETDVMTCNEAATCIGCTRRTIERYRLRGWLHTIRLANSRILFVRKEVEALREELLAKRFKYSPDAQAIVVQASQDPLPKPSLHDDPDPIIFSPEVWEAVRKYQAAKQER